MYLFRNVPTVETISLVVIDGPVVCSLAGWLPRAVSEYLSFQLVALSGATDIVLWMVQDSNPRWCGVPTFPICCLVACALVRWLSTNLPNHPCYVSYCGIF